MVSLRNDIIAPVQYNL